jgi:phytoene synthase
MSDDGVAFASFERRWLDANPEQSAVLIFLPSPQRERARAFGTLIHELSQTAFGVREPAVAAAKLSWWQQELISAAAGNPRHPISRELFRDARTTMIDATSWRALIDGAIMQLDASLPSTFDELRTSLSAFFTPVASIENQLTETGDSQTEAVADLWISSHLMRAVETISVNTERSALPLDLMARHGISRAELGEPGPKRSAVLKDFITRVRDVIKKNQTIATHASLGRRVRARIDARLADRAVNVDDPARYLSERERDMRWRAVWWAWREARALTSR